MRYGEFRKLRLLWIVVLLAAIVVLALLSAGCREVNGVFYSEFRDIPSSGWSPEKPLGFDPWPADSADSAGRFDLYMCVRYSGKKPIAPLRARYVCEDESGTLYADTVSFRLFDGNGLPSGRGRYGVYEALVPLTGNFVLRPGFGVDLYSLSPEEDSEGLLGIGVVLARSGADPDVTIIKNFSL